MEGQWLYGYMPHPDMAYCGFAPNNAALVKIMAVGQVKLLLCELTSLVETSKTKVGPPCENLSYIEGMRNWDAARIEEMVNSGVAMFQGIHDKKPASVRPSGLDNCGSVDGWFEVDLWLQESIHASNQKGHGRVPRRPSVVQDLRPEHHSNGCSHRVHDECMTNAVIG